MKTHSFKLFSQLISQHISILGVILILQVSASGCLDKSSDAVSGANSTGPALLNASVFVGSAGVKNVNQVLQSMATVTGLQTSDITAQVTMGGTTTSIANQYQVISPFLSATGQPATVNPAMLLAITGLAGQVCHTFAAKEAASPRVLAGTGIVFSSGNASFASTTWNTQFTATPAVTNSVVSALSNQFWGRAPTSSELNLIAGLITSSVPSGSGPVPDTGTQGVIDILVLACTAMLVSPEFLSG